MRVAVSLLMLSACGKDLDTGSTEDLTEPPDTLLAPVDEPSNGECPDMTQSNTGVFSSANADRTVTMVIPQEVTDSMPLVYFFHGLMDPGSTPNPTAYMASGLGLQRLADELGVVFAIPQSGQMSRMGFNFFMWNVEEPENDDVTLFDDLRACASQTLNIDLSRVHAVGMSGGALFTTVVTRDRGDTLASMVEMSGGSDVDMLTFDSPLSAYEASAYAVPSLLISGGSSDVWPGGGITLVDFTAATDTLARQLVEDDHFVVRCEHSSGHAIPMTAMAAAEVWIESHSFDSPSPIKQSGINEFSQFDNWCEVLN